MKLALVGIGKIARDQHLPAIEGEPRWELGATVSRNAGVDGIEGFVHMDAMLSARPDIIAVSLALPPQPRFAYAQAAIAAGRHVMLEKPPGATLAEIHALERMAEERGVTLFASWHSAAAPGVALARDWLRNRTLRRVTVTWREDVREWHPGQDWVFAPGGLGVFDPGINALSILSAILPQAVHLTAADLAFPANRQMPIAAELTFHLEGGEMTMGLDWRHEGEPVWDIRIETGNGTLHLREGGNKLWIDGNRQDVGETGEYPALYARFAELVEGRESEMDLTPMVHVADAFTLGARREVAAFDW